LIPASPCEICCGKFALAKFVSEFSGFPLSVSFHQCSTSIVIYTLLLPEGKKNEAWEPSKKQCSFENGGALDREVLSVFQYKKQMGEI
jgi:hypothetical protein